MDSAGNWASFSTGTCGVTADQLGARARPGEDPAERADVAPAEQWIVGPPLGRPRERRRRPEERAVDPDNATRGCCALYSCAWAAAPIGASPMARPVRKRRREITGRPAPRRRGPATGTMERTLLRRAPGGLRRDCPGQQENGATGSRESGPPEGRYKANLAVAAPRLSVHGPEGGGRVRHYVGVDWAD